MKKKRGEKRLLEAWYGKKMPKNQWEFVKPDEEDDIGEVAKGLVSRIVEREFEFAGAFGAYQQVARIAEDEEIQKLVKQFREGIFFTSEPPFNSAQAAVDWLYSEYLRWAARVPTEWQEWERYPLEERFRIAAELRRQFPTTFSEIDWNTLCVWWPGDQLPDRPAGLTFLNPSVLLEKLDRS